MVEGLVERGFLLFFGYVLGTACFFLDPLGQLYHRLLTRAAGGSSVRRKGQHAYPFVVGERTTEQRFQGGFGGGGEFRCQSVGSGFEFTFDL